MKGLGVRLVCGVSGDNPLLCRTLIDPVGKTVTLAVDEPLDDHAVDVVARGVNVGFQAGRDIAAAKIRQMRHELQLQRSIREVEEVLHQRRARLLHMEPGGGGAGLVPRLPTTELPAGSWVPTRKRD